MFVVTSKDEIARSRTKVMFRESTLMLICRCVAFELTWPFSCSYRYLVLKPLTLVMTIGIVIGLFRPPLTSRCLSVGSMTSTRHADAHNKLTVQLRGNPSKSTHFGRLPVFRRLPSECLIYIYAIKLYISLTRNHDRQRLVLPVETLTRSER